MFGHPFRVHPFDIRNGADGPVIFVLGVISAVRLIVVDIRKDLDKILPGMGDALESSLSYYPTASRTG